LTGTYASPVIGPSEVKNTISNGTIIANVDPFYDDCGGAAPNVAMTGKNIRDLLNTAGVSWGWFYGDFAAVSITGGVATCVSQYNPHYAPFDYYRSTSNPHHLLPTSLAAIGSDTAVRPVKGTSPNASRYDTLIAEARNHANCLVLALRLELIRLAA
jgi:hypothetical protein